MLCKWCGMESATTDQCSWCHRPLSAAASDSTEASAEGQTATKSRAPVSVRRGPAQRVEPEPSQDAEDSPLLAGGNAAVGVRAAQPPPPPAPIPAPSSSSTDTHARPIIGLRKPGGKEGSHIPAPSMPPVKPASTLPTSTPGAAPHKHMPAPAVLPVSQQNRAGGTMPKSPHTPLKPVMAPPPKLATPPPVATAAPTTARRDNGSVADAGPVAESGGLAEGIAAPRLPSPAGNEVHAPALGAISAVQSKYYPGQVVDPTSGTHYDSTTGQPRDVPTAKREPEIEVVWDTPALSTATLVMRYLAVFAGILVVAGLLGYAFKGYYVATLLVCLFVAGLLMPIMEAVPKQRDDSDDVWIFAGLIMIFGPTIGLIIYSVFGLLRQSANPAVVGCFIVSILLQAVLFFTASPTLLLFGPPWVQGHGFDLRTLFINWSAFAALAGWYSANLFHKFDE